MKREEALILCQQLEGKLYYQLARPHFNMTVSVGPSLFYSLSHYFNKNATNISDKSVSSYGFAS